MKRVFSLLIAAVALASVSISPANSQPLTVVASATQSADLNYGSATIVNNQYISGVSGILSIRNLASVDNISGTVTPTANFAAAAYHYECTFQPTFGCTSWNAPMQNVSATAFQMDPAGNSATFRATLTDTMSQQHAYNITLARPTSTSANYQLANVWVDGQSAKASAPYLTFARNGYIATGTVGSHTLVNAPSPCPANGVCGNTYGQTTTSLTASSAQIN